MTAGWYRPAEHFHRQRDVALFAKSRIGQRPTARTGRAVPLPSSQIQCVCGHVRRLHGSRPGLQLTDDRCRACHCAAFGGSER